MLLTVKRYRHHLLTAGLASLLGGLLTWWQQPIEIMVIDRTTHQPVKQAQVNIKPKMDRIPGHRHCFRLAWFLIPGTVLIQSDGYQSVQTKMLLVPNGEYQVELEPQ
jgi:hypothetical protein